MAKQTVKKAQTKVAASQIEEAEVLQETKYDPSVPYKWSEEDLFPLTGTEYGFLFNVLMQKKAEHLQQLEILNILERKLKESVDAGIAKPDPDAKQTQGQ